MRRDSVARASRTHGPVEVHGIIPALPIDDYDNVASESLARTRVRGLTLFLSSARRAVFGLRVAAATLLLVIAASALRPGIHGQDADDDDVEDRARPADDDDDEPGPVRTRDRRRPGDGRTPGQQGRDGRTSEAPAAAFDTVLRVKLDASPTAQGAVLDRTAFVPVRDGRLVRVDLDKGRLDGSITVQATQGVAAGDGLVFVATKDALAAMEPQGTARWSLPLAGGFSAPPLWDTGWLIAATASGEVLGIRAKDGHVLWTRHVRSPAATLPAIAADRLYVPLRDGRLVALELLTGNVVWEQSLGGVVGIPLALDDRLFVGTSDKYFYCLSTQDGDRRWRVRVGGTVDGAPVVDTRHVYFTALDNVLRALNRSTGALAWMAGLPFRPLGGPLLLGDAVFVASIGLDARGYSAANGRIMLDRTGGEELLAAPPQVLPNTGLPELTKVLLLTRDLELLLLQRRLDVPTEPLREVVGVPVAIEAPPNF